MKCIFNFHELVFKNNSVNFCELAFDKNFGPGNATSNTFIMTKHDFYISETNFFPTNSNMESKIFYFLCPLIEKSDNKKLNNLFHKDSIC